MNISKDVQTALTNFANAQFQLGVATAQLETILNPFLKEIEAGKDSKTIESQTDTQK